MRGTAATHPTIQGKATTVRELGESRKESPRLSVREYVKPNNLANPTGIILPDPVPYQDYQGLRLRRYVWHGFCFV